MKFFADTTSIEELSSLIELGLVDGVTTNPSLVAVSGREMTSLLSEICELVDGPVSAEVTTEEPEDMLSQAHDLLAIAPNIVVKVPSTYNGLNTCRELASQGKDVNVTLCFSSIQALLAARAGARFVSPFVGRIDDIGQSGMDLIADIVDIFENYDFATEVLVASVRSIDHIKQAALIGADAITAPPKILRTLADHPLTDSGLEKFLRDFRRSSQ